jgi:hypothetical protein
MTRRFDPLLVGAVIAVGLAQLLFTVVADPHARCAPSADIAEALADRGLEPQERCLNDATAYHLLAQELAESGRYERPYDRVLLDAHRPTAEYPPMFPFALSLLDRAGVDSIDAQQAVIGTLTAMLSAFGAILLARALDLGRTASAIAALLVGLQPLLLQANALLMTEGLFAAIAIFVVVTALRVARRATVRSVLALGLALGFGALTRGEGLIWTPIVAVLVALASTGPTRRRVAIGVAILGIAAAVVTPWTLRNHARFDAIVPVSNNLGTVLDGANCDPMYRGSQIGGWKETFVVGSSDRSTPCFEGFRIEDPNFSEAAEATRARTAGIDYATDHASRWPVVVAARLGRTFGVFNAGQQINYEVFAEGRIHAWQRIGTATWWLTLPLAVGGLAVLAIRRTRDAWVLVIPWVAVVATTIVTYGNQRFRIGLDAAAIVLAVSAAHHVVGRRGWRGRVARAAAP